MCDTLHEGKEFNLLFPLPPPLTTSNHMYMLLKEICGTSVLRLKEFAETVEVATFDKEKTEGVLGGQCMP